MLQKMRITSQVIILISGTVELPETYGNNLSVIHRLQNDPLIQYRPSTVEPVTVIVKMFSMNGHFFMLCPHSDFQIQVALPAISALPLLLIWVCSGV